MAAGNYTAKFDRIALPFILKWTNWLLVTVLYLTFLILKIVHVLWQIVYLKISILQLNRYSLSWIIWFNSIYRWVDLNLEALIVRISFLRIYRFFVVLLGLLDIKCLNQVQFIFILLICLTTTDKAHLFRKFISFWLVAIL